MSQTPSGLILPGGEPAKPAKPDINEVLGHQTVDLLPTEKTLVHETQVTLQRILKQKMDNAHNKKERIRVLKDVHDLAVGMYREHGLVAIVDIENVEVDDYDNSYFSPIIVISGRVKDEDFDFERAQSETQNGLLDGIEGKITEKGEWKSADRQF